MYSDNKFFYRHDFCDALVAEDRTLWGDPITLDVVLILELCGGELPLCEEGVVGFFVFLALGESITGIVPRISSGN
jgi:hypothetical protein